MITVVNTDLKEIDSRIEMSTEDSKCRLCNKSSKIGIGIFTKQGIQLEILSILSEHFKIQPIKDDPFSKRVCKKCWKITDQFHKLYRMVAEIESDNQKLIEKLNKTEYPVLSHVEIKVEENLGEYEIIEAFNRDPLFKIEDRCEENGNENGTTRSIKVEKNKDSETSNKIIPRLKIRRGKNRITNKLSEEEQDIYIGKFLKPICELCGITMETFTELTKHYRSEHKTIGFLKCCNRKIFRRIRLYEHLRNHEQPDKNKFRCTTCGKMYLDKDYFVRHLRTHNLDPTNDFKCTICERQYNSQTALTRHIDDKHNGTRKSFICDICNKCMHTKHSIIQHLIIHVGLSKCICDICGREFNQRGALTTHHKIHHLGFTKKLTFTCKICGKVLASNKSLGLHMHRHEITKETCQICGKMYPHEDALLNHIKYVHSSKRFPCKLCDKVLKSHISLKEHMSTHTGFSLYKCCYCFREFNSGSQMYKHRKKIHPIEWQKDYELKVNSQLNTTKKFASLLSVDKEMAL